MYFKGQRPDSARCRGGKAKIIILKVMPIIIPGINWEKPTNGQNEETSQWMNQKIQSEKQSQNSYFLGIIPKKLPFFTASLIQWHSYWASGGYFEIILRDGWRLHNRLIFGKVPKVWGAILIQKLISHILDLETGLLSLQLKNNKLQYDFRKWGVGQRLFWTFPKIHLFWKRHRS